MASASGGRRGQAVVELCRRAARPEDVDQHLVHRPATEPVFGRGGLPTRYRDLTAAQALLSFRGISTPSLTAQGKQRRPPIFNSPRDIPANEHRYWQYGEA
jgi:hypothetical protein